MIMLLINDIIARCVEDYIVETFDDIVLNVHVFYFDIMNHSSEFPKCRCSFYDTNARVGVITRDTYIQSVIVDYNDPEFLNVIKRWVCDILGLDR